MTTLASFKSGFTTAFLAFLLTTTTVAQDSAPSDGLASVPSNAVAFVHFDAREMMLSPGMTIPAEIFAGVQQEADELFQQHLGVQISQLKTVTFVAPNIESLMALQSNGEQTGFALFAFETSVKKKFVEGNPATWRPATVGNEIVFLEKSSGFALFHSSANTIAIGSKAGIKWFIDNRDNRAKGGLRSTMKLADSGHVTIGINGDAIPSELKMFIPPEMKTFASAKSASINLDFTNGIAAHVQLDFDSEQDAANAVTFARQNVEYARAFLNQEATSVQGQLDNQSADLWAAMSPLAKLALLRYGDKILQKATIDQSARQLQAHLAIEGFDGQMLVLVSLSAIQAIGSASEEEFQSIADELNQHD